MDFLIGKIITKLRDLGLEENTLLLFTSDNGPWLIYGNHAGSAGPLREGKHSTFEGGVRVFAVARWPGHITPGSTCSVPAMNIDLLPTIASLANASLPENKIDGKNIWPLFKKGNAATSPHEAYYFYRNNELQAVLKGNWKLHFDHDYLSNEIINHDRKPGEFVTRHLKASLFDLGNDIGETTDVSGKHPAIAVTLRNLAEAFSNELREYVRPPGTVNK